MVLINKTPGSWVTFMNIGTAMGANTGKQKISGRVLLNLPRSLGDLSSRVERFMLDFSDVSRVGVVSMTGPPSALRTSKAANPKFTHCVAARC
jgi:hypothetical protein